MLLCRAAPDVEAAKGQGPEGDASLALEVNCHGPLEHQQHTMPLCPAAPDVEAAKGQGAEADASLGPEVNCHGPLEHQQQTMPLCPASPDVEAAKGQGAEADASLGPEATLLPEDASQDLQSSSLFFEWSSIDATELVSGMSTSVGPTRGGPGPGLSDGTLGKSGRSSMETAANREARAAAARAKRENLDGQVSQMHLISTHVARAAQLAARDLQGIIGHFKGCVDKLQRADAEKSVPLALAERRLEMRAAAWRRTGEEAATDNVQRALEREREVLVAARQRLVRCGKAGVAKVAELERSKVEMVHRHLFLDTLEHTHRDGIGNRASPRSQQLGRGTSQRSGGADAPEASKGGDVPLEATSRSLAEPSGRSYAESEAFSETWRRVEATEAEAARYEAEVHEALRAVAGEAEGAAAETAARLQQHHDEVKRRRVRLEGELECTRASMVEQERRVHEIKKDLFRLAPMYAQLDGGPLSPDGRGQRAQTPAEAAARRHFDEASARQAQLKLNEQHLVEERRRTRIWSSVEAACAKMVGPRAHIPATERTAKEQYCWHQEFVGSATGAPIETMLPCSFNAVGTGEVEALLPRPPTEKRGLGPSRPREIYKPLSPKVLDNLRSKVAASTYTDRIRGWRLEEILSSACKSGAEHMERHELKAMLRRKLKVAESTLSDEELTSLCLLLDSSGSGAIDVMELAKLLCINLDGGDDSSASTRATTPAGRQSTWTSSQSPGPSCVSPGFRPFTPLLPSSRAATKSTALLGSGPAESGIPGARKPHAPVEALASPRKQSGSLKLAALLASPTASSSSASPQSARGASRAGSTDKHGTSLLTGWGSLRCMGQEGTALSPDLTQKIRRRMCSTASGVAVYSERQRVPQRLAPTASKGPDVVLAERLDYNQVLEAIRHRLHIRWSDFDDKEVGALCATLDVDGVGSVAVEDLMAFFMSGCSLEKDWGTTLSRDAREEYRKKVQTMTCSQLLAAPPSERPRREMRKAQFKEMRQVLWRAFKLQPAAAVPCTSSVESRESPIGECSSDLAHVSMNLEAAWSALDEGEKAEHEAPAVAGGGSAAGDEAGALPADFAGKVRATIKAYASIAQDGHRLGVLFGNYDQDGRGCLSFTDVRCALRRALLIPKRVLSEEEVVRWCRGMDIEGAGVLRISSLLAFLAGGGGSGPAPPMSPGSVGACAPRVAHMEPGRLENIRSLVQGAMYCGGSRDRDVDVLLGRLDRQSFGRLPFNEVRRVMRRIYHLKPGAISDKELDALGPLLGMDGSGEVFVEALRDFLRPVSKAQGDEAT
mmetsp:Transcript_150394/g.481323  ORF Transcript_150394/g.481323 Transcript_150394/m.481323 type:complete len:1292 (+) Transcript_150394:77-3952(+)